MIRTGIAFGWFACISWLCAAGYEVLLVKRHEHWVTRFIMKYGNRRNRDGDLLGDGNAMKSTTTTSTSSLNGQQYELLARRDTSATAVTATNANTLARQGGRTGKDDEEDEGVAVVVVENSKV